MLDWSKANKEWRSTDRLKLRDEVCDVGATRANPRPKSICEAWVHIELDEQSGGVRVSATRPGPGRGMPCHVHVNVKLMLESRHIRVSQGKTCTTDVSKTSIVQLGEYKLEGVPVVLQSDKSASRTVDPLNYYWDTGGSLGDDHQFFF